MRLRSVVTVAFCLTFLLLTWGAEGNPLSDEARGAALYREQMAFYEDLVRPSLYQQQRSLYNTMLEDEQMLAHAKAMTASGESYSSSTATTEASIEKALAAHDHAAHGDGGSYSSTAGSMVDQQKKTDAETANPVAKGRAYVSAAAYTSALVAATHKAEAELHKSIAGRIAALKVLDAAKGKEAAEEEKANHDDVRLNATKHAPLPPLPPVPKARTDDIAAAVSRHKEAAKVAFATQEAQANAMRTGGIMKKEEAIFHKLDSVAKAARANATAAEKAAHDAHAGVDQAALQVQFRNIIRDSTHVDKNKGIQPDNTLEQNKDALIHNELEQDHLNHFADFAVKELKKWDGIAAKRDKIREALEPIAEKAEALAAAQHQKMVAAEKAAHAAQKTLFEERQKLIRSDHLAGRAEWTLDREEHGEIQSGKARVHAAALATKAAKAALAKTIKHEGAVVHTAEATERKEQAHPAKVIRIETGIQRAEKVKVASLKKQVRVAHATEAADQRRMQAAQGEVAQAKETLDVATRLKKYLSTLKFKSHEEREKAIQGFLRLEEKKREHRRQMALMKARRIKDKALLAKAAKVKKLIYSTLRHASHTLGKAAVADNKARLAIAHTLEEFIKHHGNLSNAHAILKAADGFPDMPFNKHSLHTREIHADKTALSRAKISALVHHINATFVKRERRLKDLQHRVKFDDYTGKKTFQRGVKKDAKRRQKAQLEMEKAHLNRKASKGLRKSARDEKMATKELEVAESALRQATAQHASSAEHAKGLSAHLHLEETNLEIAKQVLGQAEEQSDTAEAVLAWQKQNSRFDIDESRLKLATDENEENFERAYLAEIEKEVHELKEHPPWQNITEGEAMYKPSVMPPLHYPPHYPKYVVPPLPHPRFAGNEKGFERERHARQNPPHGPPLPININTTAEVNGAFAKRTQAKLDAMRGEREAYQHPDYFARNGSAPAYSSTPSASSGPPRNLNATEAAAKAAAEQHAVKVAKAESKAAHTRAAKAAAKEVVAARKKHEAVAARHALEKQAEAAKRATKSHDKQHSMVSAKAVEEQAKADNATVTAHPAAKAVEEQAKADNATVTAHPAAKAVEEQAKADNATVTAHPAGMVETGSLQTVLPLPPMPAAMRSPGQELPSPPPQLRPEPPPMETELMAWYQADPEDTFQEPAGSDTKNVEEEDLVSELEN